MNKVFVTGADGMLGSSICRELLQQGYEVKALCFPNRKTTTLNNLPIEIVEGDVSNKDLLVSAMKGCNYVIHVAALMSLWPRRSELIRRVNIDGTKNVMQAAEELKMVRMVHIGTASSFNNGSKENPGNENNPYVGHKFKMDYIDSKYEAQNLLLDQFKNTGFPVIIINPTFMIGPFDSGPSSGKMLIAIYKNKLKLYNRGGKNFVCSKDVAVATVNALKKGRLGQCYIAGNENLEYKEFFEKAFKKMNKPFVMTGVPNPILLTAGFLGSVAGRVTKKPPVLSMGIALLAKENNYFTSEKAVKELDMPQTPIEVGIEQCLDWFKENKYI